MHDVGEGIVCDRYSRYSFPFPRSNRLCLGMGCFLSREIAVEAHLGIEFFELDRE